MSEPAEQPSHLAALLRALHALAFIARHLDPDQLEDILAAIGTPDADLRAAAEGAPASDNPIAQQLAQATQATLVGYDALRAATALSDLRGAYQAVRRETQALEALYPLAALVPAIGGYFLNQEARTNQALRDRLANPSHNDTGVMHAANDRGQRGGFSLFIPESYTPDHAHPLVMALHGGSGHGRSFLWNWVREARSRGVIVACPTSTGPTWALGGADADSPLLASVLAFVAERWNLDRTRLLLTGMSDGGSFTLLSGLQAASPFTHLAPVAAGFHPLLVQMGDADRVQNLPIRITHGQLDWMFPVELARQCQQSLANFGARVTYQEIADLSHVYPRDDLPALLDWLFTPP